MASLATQAPQGILAEGSGIEASRSGSPSQRPAARNANPREHGRGEDVSKEGLCAPFREADKNLHEALVAFYSEHHPSKVSNVPLIEQRFAGDRIVELWATLGMRYSLVPHDVVQWLAGTMHRSSLIQHPLADQLPPEAQGSLERTATALAAVSGERSARAELQGALQADDMEAAAAIAFRWGCPDDSLRPQLWSALVHEGSSGTPRCPEARKVAYQELREAVAQHGHEVEPDQTFDLKEIRVEAESDAASVWKDEGEFFRAEKLTEAVMLMSLVLARRFSCYIRGSCEMAALVLYVFTQGEVSRIADVEAEACWCLSRILQAFLGGRVRGAAYVTQARKGRVRRVRRLLRLYDPELADFLAQSDLLHTAALRLGAALCARAGFSLRGCILLWDRFLSDPKKFDFCDHIVVAVLLVHRADLLHRVQGALLETLLSGSGSLRETLMGLPRRASSGKTLQSVIDTASAICAFERWCGPASATPFPVPCQASREYSKTPPGTPSSRTDYRDMRFQLTNALGAAEALEALDTVMGQAQDQVSGIWGHLCNVWQQAGLMSSQVQVRSPSQAGDPKADGSRCQRELSTTSVDWQELEMRSLGIEAPLLTPALARCLQEHLPVRFRLPGAVEWTLRYTPKAHGISMATLFRNLAQRPGTILVVKDDEDHIFGGFTPDVWEPSRRFYGSGEAFVYTFGQVSDPEAASVKVFPWTTRNTWFMYADMQLIALGGGDGHHAVAVHGDFLRGLSSPTPTFGNSILASKEEFVVRDMEIWALEEVD